MFVNNKIIFSNVFVLDGRDVSYAATFNTAGKFIVIVIMLFGRRK